MRLWMQDNGVGIPKEHQERIFRVFERLQGARYPGTGIGLFIVRKALNAWTARWDWNQRWAKAVVSGSNCRRG